MRRIWAYIITAITTLVVVGASFASVFIRSTFNIEYSGGTEMTFRVANLDENGEEIDMGTETGAETISQVMADRLDTYGVSRYKIEIQNQDTIKVSLKSESDEELSRIQTYLSFNGSLGLSNAHDKVLTTSDNDENPSFLPAGAKASLKTTSTGYPSVVLPVDVDNEYYKTMLEETQADIKDSKTEFGEGQSSQDDSGEETTTYSYYFYLWFNYDDSKCTFDNLKENKQIATDRFLMRFNVTEGEGFYFEDGKNNKLYSPVNIDTDGDGVASASEKEKGYNTARYIVNLINASELDYKVTYLYSKNADAWNENLIAEGGLAMSKTLIAFIFAILIVSLILVYLYRLGAVSVIVNTLATLFLAIGAIVLFKAEFSVFAIAALVAVTLASLASGTLYLQKIKDEAYRGRSIKKANSEAGKKALLPIIDINVVLVIIGAFCYILGGTLMRTFAVVSVFGGLASLVLNITLHRIMMWLATNATISQGKYELFGIDSDDVPNLVEEEKQQFYGSFAEKDFTKKRKPVFIVALVLFVASLAGGITFGALNNGQIYRQKSGVEVSQIYFETTDENSSLTEEASIRNILDNTQIYLEGKEDKAEKLSAYIDTFEETNTWTTVDPLDENNTITHYTYLVTLTSAINPDKYFAKYSDDTTTITGNNTINDLFTLLISDNFNADKDNISLKSTLLVTSEQPKAWPIALATLVGTVVCGLYLILRYRLSRGLAAFILGLGASTVAWGFFSITRLALSNYLLAMVPVTALIAFTLMLFVANKERDLLLDDKVKDNTSAHRQETLLASNSQIYALSLMNVIYAVLIGACYLGVGPLQTGTMFIALALYALLTLILVSALYAPMASFFYRHMKLDNIERKRKPRKKNKKTAQRARGAEPEEAVFIGIND